VKPAATAIRTVAVVVKGGVPAGVETARELGEWLGAREVRVLYDRATSRSRGRGEGLARTELTADNDLVIVVGGDGTLLSVARSAVPLGIPILGVNLGSLGFLTELNPDEWLSGLEAVLDGRYSVEERQALRVRHLRSGREQAAYALLNDAVIAKSALARMIDIETRVDGERVAVYTSDGLIVSTPTGSTAYSLSAGGPILDPRMDAFVIAPICPHTMTYRPLVVPGTVTVGIRLRNPGDTVYVTLDGQIGFPFEGKDALEIDAYPAPARLLRVADRSFFEVLRRKLRWGAR
jgi:NAD+ kinase